MAKLLLNLSEAYLIAIHSLVLLAITNKPLSVKTIAKKLACSPHHLSKVLQKLVKYEILKSNRGPKGGFIFNIPPEKITLLRIYEILEGKLTTPVCPFNQSDCPFKICIFQETTLNTMLEFKNYLQNTTIAQCAIQNK